MLYIYLVTPMR